MLASVCTVCVLASLMCNVLSHNNHLVTYKREKYTCKTEKEPLTKTVHFQNNAKKQQLGTLHMVITKNQRSYVIGDSNKNKNIITQTHIKEKCIHNIGKNHPLIKTANTKRSSDCNCKKMCNETLFCVVQVTLDLHEHCLLEEVT